MSSRFQQLWLFGRQYPFAGVCATLSVFLAVGSLALWLGGRSLAKTQIKTTLRGEAVVANLNSGAQLQQELAFVRQTIKRVDSVLASEEKLEDTVNYFYNLEEATKASVEELRHFNAPPPETGSPYVRLPFSLKVSGTFPQVAAYLHGLETGPRLATINNFSFRKRAGSIVTVEFTVDLLGKK